MARGGVCLTTYGMVGPNLELLCEQVPGEEALAGAAWDYLILDEGHKIKNPDIQLSQALSSVPSRHRLLLTGTPVQNHLDEIWALFDFVAKGKLLGDRCALATPISHSHLLVQTLI
jgi:SNF2 family DNA or RNA helicase